MKNKLNLISISVLLALAGCGGSDGSDTSNNSSNQAPTFNPELLSSVFNGQSLPPSILVKAAEGEEDIIVARSSTEIVTEIEQWNVNFSEKDISFTNADSDNGFSDYFDVDLLAGISDADGDQLSVKNLTFIWVGPNCANTLVDAVNFPEVCDPILAELGFASGDNVDGAEAALIRELQNNPIIDRPIYGFEILQEALRVTPRNFSPLLLTTQTAQLGINYEVTDGEHSIQRKLVVNVYGADSGPEFIQLNADGSPVLNAEGEKVQVEIAPLQLSEKDQSITIDIAQGLFDQDIYDDQLRAAEIGDLTNFYNIGNDGYRAQNVTVDGLSIVTSNGLPIPEGFSSTQRFVDPVTGVTTQVALALNPSLFADELEFGESIELTITYGLTDGNNTTEREITATLFGAAPGDNPPIPGDNIAVNINSTDNPSTISLLEGAIELDRQNMSVAGLTAENDTEDSYGFFINGNSITVAPSFFTYLQPGQTKSFSYSYQISDGSLLSAEKTIDVTITGSTANLAAMTEGSDPGFESGTLDNNVWRYDPDRDGTTSSANLVITDTDAHSGSNSLLAMEDNLIATLTAAGIQQGRIDENNLFYVNYFSKISTLPWSTMTTFINKGDVFSTTDSVFDMRLPALGLTNEWVERTATLRATDYFDPSLDEEISLSFLLASENNLIDDVSIIQFNNTRGIDRLISGSTGNFPTPSPQGWSVSGGASLEVTLDANRVANSESDYGLQVINNTDSTQTISLDPNFFPQGSIKKGMRYVIQFSLNTPSYTVEGGAVPLDVGIQEVGGNNISRRVNFAERSDTLWETYYMHIDTTSDSVYFDNGMVNTDVDFDWESATVQPFINIRAGDELHIDNIIMYPVPKY